MTDREHRETARRGAIAVPAEDSASRSAVRRLFICYMSGMDLRRIDARTTPFMTRLLAECPWTEFRNLPSNELLPTMLTGVDPTRHGVWGVRLKPDASGGGRKRLVDLLPDLVTTSVQCFLHFLTNAYDLAAIPPRRRRAFAITRTKYRRRNRRPDALYRIGGLETFLGAVGRDRARYIFSSTSDPARRLLPKLCRPDSVLELLELYSLDRYQQWNLDDEAEVGRFYGVIDGFLRALHEKCSAGGMTLMILSDHGHDSIRESIDIAGRLRTLPVPESDYCYFTEVSSARFWFHTEAARRSVTELLAAIGRGTVLNYREMGRYGVPLPDAGYGEVFFFLDPGYIFFPHDFYQPLANLFLGLTDRMQRKRLAWAGHRGNHGFLPGVMAERAFVLLADPTSRVAGEHANILDIAPSVLHLLGRPAPASMEGRCLFAAGGDS